MISFSCSCGMKFKVKDEYAGRSTKCPTCKHGLVVPLPDKTVIHVPEGQIDGTASSLAKAGVDGGVTVGVTGAIPGQKSVSELLSRQATKGQRYIIEKEIARGGMGAVLRAVDCDIRREVAVKYLLQQADTRSKARFVEEAQITGQLEHPNIPPVHELGVDAQKRLFFSMKMVKGRSVQQILDELQQNPKKTEYSLGRLLNILVNVCNGLAYAHSRGVVHRDLKPANIMVGDFGEVYVMDWGLAKVLKGDGQGVVQPAAPMATLVSSSSASVPSAMPALPTGSGFPSHSSKVATSREPDADLTQDGSVVGTPVYMPPEQANGQIDGIDARSDIYSLGAILYEMLTLQPPVDKEGGYLAILMRVTQGEIVPPEQRARGRSIPRELSAITMKALAKDPHHRYQNVEALRKDIERFQEGRSVSAKEDTKREMLWKFVKRNKLASAFTTLLAIVLLWGSVVNWLARREAEQANEKVKTRTEKAIPALLEAARLGVERRNFPNALEQVNLALDYAPDNAAASLLKGQLLIVEQDFSGARVEIERYLREQPKDTEARTLTQLCQRPHPDDEATSLLFARTFNQQQMYGLIDGVLAPYGKTSVESRKYLLQRYRKQIGASWPGWGRRLEINTEGLRLDFSNFADLRDLSPMRDMPLASLNLAECQHVQDLTPLRGMLLTSLNLHYCQQVRDLTPLKGMPLKHIELFGNLTTDLTVLRGMPLTSLDIAYCSELHDLSELEGMNLETIALTARNITKGMDVLRRMKTLKTIATNAAGGAGPTPYPAADFWKKYDAGEFTK